MLSVAAEPAHGLVAVLLQTLVALAAVAPRFTVTPAEGSVTKGWAELTASVTTSPQVRLLLSTTAYRAACRAALLSARFCAKRNPKTIMPNNSRNSTGASMANSAAVAPCSRRRVESSSSECVVGLMAPWRHANDVMPISPPRSMVMRLVWPGARYPHLTFLSAETLSADDRHLARGGLSPSLLLRVRRPILLLRPNLPSRLHGRRGHGRPRAAT